MGLWCLVAKDFFPKSHLHQQNLLRFDLPELCALWQRCLWTRTGLWCLWDVHSFIFSRLRSKVAPEKWQCKWTLGHNQNILKRDKKCNCRTNQILCSWRWRTRKTLVTGTSWPQRWGAVVSTAQVLQKKQRVTMDSYTPLTLTNVPLSYYLRC